MTDTHPQPKGKGPSLLYLLPLGFFVSLVLIFFVQLRSGTDPEAIPSALVGRLAPAFDLPALEGTGVPGLSRADLDGKVTVVNIFASWCAPCRQEHPILTRLSASGVRVVGINYKDNADNARRFLAELGNPYSAIGVDARGRAAIDWGVYGVPETFVVGPDGVIRHKFIGPLTPEAVRDVLMPAIAKAAAP